MIRFYFEKNITFLKKLRENCDGSYFVSNVYMSTGTNSIHSKTVKAGLDFNRTKSLYRNIIQVSELIYDEAGNNSHFFFMKCFPVCGLINQRGNMYFHEGWHFFVIVNLYFLITDDVLQPFKKVWYAFLHYVEQIYKKWHLKSIFKVGIAFFFFSIFAK